MIKIVIAGGSGFIGRHLTSSFINKGYEVVHLSRSTRSVGGARVVQWDGKSVSSWATELEGAKAVINLCGAPVVKRWTKANQKEMRDSRIEPSVALADAISACKHSPDVWINASGIGFYGNRGDESLSESSKKGVGFFADLSYEWESACLESGVSPRTVVTRVGLVLGRDGGAFPILAKLARMFLGGPAGSGRQWLGWIHIFDMCEMMDWIIKDSSISGAINMVAPNPVRNRELMATICQQFNRPQLPPIPDAVFRLVAELAGKEASLLLDSLRVYPVIALAKGFTFKYPELPAAIEDLVLKKSRAGVNPPR